MPPAENVELRHQAFSLWKTITLGSYATARGYYIHLLAAGFRIGHWGKDILDRAPYTRHHRELSLTLVSPTELGFPRGETFDFLCDSAVEQGLRLCPAETAAVLRSVYREQPLNEWIHVAIEPIENGTNPYPFIPVLGRNQKGRLELDADFGPGMFFTPERRIVFALGE